MLDPKTIKEALSGRYQGMTVEITGINGDRIEAQVEVFGRMVPACDFYCCKAFAIRPQHPRG